MSKTKERAKAARARRKAREVVVTLVTTKTGDAEAAKAKALAEKPWEVGDVVYAPFSHAGTHPGMVVEVRQDGRLDVARGVSYHPMARSGFGSVWLTSSFLVTGDEAGRVGLQHATRFDFSKVEGITPDLVNRVGRVSPRGAFKSRWDAATEYRARRP